MSGVREGSLACESALRELCRSKITKSKSNQASYTHRHTQTLTHTHTHIHTHIQTPTHTHKWLVHLSGPQWMFSRLFHPLHRLSVHHFSRAAPPPPPPAPNLHSILPSCKKEKQMHPTLSCLNQHVLCRSIQSHKYTRGKWKTFSIISCPTFAPWHEATKTTHANN